MKTLASVVVVAAAITLGGAVVEPWTAGNAVQAQSVQPQSSACIQNCARVRDWPIAQCREFCRGRTKKKR
jgi:hypothetical protein